ncbi:hypothetical protein ACFQ1I_26805 [Kitasatospora arboriphila]
MFASGTMRWVEALDAQGPGGHGNHGMDGRTGDLVRRVTENVLTAFAAARPPGPTRPWTTSPPFTARPKLRP